MLQFLDGDLYVAPEDEKDQTLPSEFECVICSGTVLSPKECTECQSLFCQAHLPKGAFPCPKCRGSTEYRQPHRLVMLQLSRLKFRCLKHPQCKAITTYDSYEAHLRGCGEYQRELHRCAKCQPKIQELEAGLEMIAGLIEE